MVNASWNMYHRVTDWDRRGTREVADRHGFAWIVYRSNGAPGYAYNRADARELAGWFRSLGHRTRIERF